MAAATKDALSSILTLMAEAMTRTHTTTPPHARSPTPVSTPRTPVAPRHTRVHTTRTRGPTLHRGLIHPPFPEPTPAPPRHSHARLRLQQLLLQSATLLPRLHLCRKALLQPRLHARQPGSINQVAESLRWWDQGHSEQGQTDSKRWSKTLDWLWAM